MVFVCAAGVYANTLGHDFALDDTAIITQNSFTQKGFGGIADHFTHSYWFGINGKNEGNYRPLSGAVFCIEQGLFGTQPFTGHLFNILFYALLAVVLLRWLHREELMHPLLLLAAVLLFATHPLHTEVVANIKSRDEIFCFLFFALSAERYGHWLKERKQFHLVLAGLFFLLSLLSKETSMALLPVYLILSWRHGHTLMASLKHWLVPIGVGLFYAVCYLSVTDILIDQEYHIFDNALVQEAPASSLLATKFCILGAYLRLFFVPHPLVYDYSYDTIPLTSFGDPQVILTLLVIAGLMIWTALLLQRRTDKSANRDLLGIALLVLPILPVSNLFIPIGSTMAERFLFIPTLGFVLLLCSLLEKALSRIKIAPQKPLLAIVGASALLFATVTIKRNPDWKDNATLFANDLNHLPRSAKAHHNLANIYSERGDEALDEATKRTYYETAIGLIEQAVTIYPVQEFYKQLGQLYGNLGRWDGVIKAHTVYLEFNAGNATVWMQLGIAQGMSGNMEEALTAFERSYAIDPNNADVCNNLGKTYAMYGRGEEAKHMFQEAVRIDPNHQEARENLRLSQ